MTKKVKKKSHKKQISTQHSYSPPEESASIYDRLAHLGLTENDAKVYLFLLERGTQFGGSKIAARLSLHRQYVHNSIHKLLSLELIEAIPSGARMTYKALPPQYITRLAKMNMENANRVARELDKISAVGAEQDFEIYRGTKQVMDFEEQLVSNLKNNEDQYIIGGGSKAFIDFFDKQYEEMSRLAQSYSLHTKYVGCTAEISWLERAKKANKFFEYVIIDSLPETVVQTVVRFNSVTFYSFGNPPLVYILKSRVVAGDYKKFFDMLWNMAIK